MKHWTCLCVIPLLFMGCREMNTKFTGGQSPANAKAVPDIIIDNMELGFKVEGTWYAGWSDEDYANGSMWTTEDPKGNDQATFSFNIYTSGTYEVFEWHGGDPSYDHADNVPHTVNYHGGSKTILVNQQKNEGCWNSLGRYPFIEDHQYSVVINNNAHGNVIADAVKLVFVSE